MLLCILFLTLSCLYYKTNAISQQGNIGLWSDSECNSKSSLTSHFGEPDPIALNFTLLPDICDVPGATVHSYRVVQSATCANGTTAMFTYYNSNNCTADPSDEDPNPGSAKQIMKRQGVGSTLLGECLALIAFNSLAFICEGVAPKNEKFVSLSTLATVSTTASSSTIPTVSFVYISISPPNSSAAIVSTAASSATTPSVSSTFTSTSSSNHSATASSSFASSTPASSNVGSSPGLFAGRRAGLGVVSTVGVLAIAALCFS